MTSRFKCALTVAALAVATHASAQITFYEHDNFQGQSFTTQRPIRDFTRYGFNDRASSVQVTANRWEVCDDVRFEGRCVVLRRGNYPSLSAMGLNDRVSSVRNVSTNARIEDDRYAPAPVVDYDYRRRGGERLFEANVVAVRAIVGGETQRCWIEREQVGQEQRRDNSTAGGVAGALIGGIIGHQIGGGTGRALATAGGVVAGAAIGSHAGRDSNGNPVRMADVQRCTSVPDAARPAYWDVTYEFRGQEFHVQMSTQPGNTVTVNRDGEPRALN